jgi:hypothetical protein
MPDFLTAYDDIVFVYFYQTMTHRTIVYFINISSNYA